MTSTMQPWEPWVLLLALVPCAWATQAWLNAPLPDAALLGGLGMAAGSALTLLFTRRITVASLSAEQESTSNTQALASQQAVTELLESVLPVWQHHVQSVKAQTNLLALNAAISYKG